MGKSGQWEGEEAESGVGCTSGPGTHAAERVQEVGPGNKASRPAPSDPPCSSEAPPPEGSVASPDGTRAGGQVFRHMNLGGTFHSFS